MGGRRELCRGRLHLRLLEVRLPMMLRRLLRKTGQAKACPTSREGHLAGAAGVFAFLLVSAVAAGAAEPPKVTFLRDVAPILNKVGCTAGTCHGAAKGKNGFKLSLRGYDPQFDYESLLYDLSGRRFNRADPGKSLMLAKPSQEVAHGGGQRFANDSDYYKTIYNWIA